MKQTAYWGSHMDQQQDLTLPQRRQAANMALDSHTGNIELQSTRRGLERPYCTYKMTRMCCFMAPEALGTAECRPNRAMRRTRNKGGHTRAAEWSARGARPPKLRSGSRSYTMFWQTNAGLKRRLPRSHHALIFAAPLIKSKPLHAAALETSGQHATCTRIHRIATPTPEQRVVSLCARTDLQSGKH